MNRHYSWIKTLINIEHTSKSLNVVPKGSHCSEDLSRRFVSFSFLFFGDLYFSYSIFLILFLF
jgi:hypothetical protein